ncbi:MAG: hypothetical protein DRN27_04915 [Thermoplasmata archaeon]|nr:MAG: hypothetical protein DRN27_04915 [Thermoplasmata archaeon]
MVRICKKHLFQKLKQKKGILFHIIGLISVVWFVIRVFPAPHRSQYPCQQLAIPFALGYIAFWSVLVFGFITWVKKVQTKTFAVSPSILIVFILLFSISSISFANVSQLGTSQYQPWDPIPKQPIGVPTGIFPGRVVWTWNPDATEKNLDGYWWESQNNDLEVIDSMFSSGLQSLTNASNDLEAWNNLFTYFNVKQGKGEHGYTPGEKIAIKVNLNNCWNTLSHIDDYKTRDNERDAHPDVVNSLLHHLTDIVGVEQSLITVYDTSRPMPNWFFDPVSSSYPDVKYIDAFGGASGRLQGKASNISFYFSDGVIRSLPVCVVDADYLINIPIMKQHPINHGVTLSGKNLFGTFIEPVMDLHPYHESGQIMGNPAPQIDLLGAEELGGKTLLYIGDALYSTLNDHRTIYHFQMEPFFDDWTNSIFLSQDPIAIDSVMYDFLHTEGPIPIEGSQNYLHQGAQPDLEVYDPENDGIFISESIGVHEHWDISESIFSSGRYSGYENQGIDFIYLGANPEESTVITIDQPAYHHLYVSNMPVNFSIRWKDYYLFPATIVIGAITVKTIIIPSTANIDHVDFFVDGVLQKQDDEFPYDWNWTSMSFGSHILTVTASYDDEITSTAERALIKLF